MNDVMCNDEFGRREQEAVELIEKANQCHVVAGSLLGQALEKAREAGDLLRYALERVPHGRRTHFLSVHFVGSVRTARVYMRISKHWNDPRVEAARNGGMDPASMNEFLAVIAKPWEEDDLAISPPHPRDKDAKEIQANDIRREVRAQFEWSLQMFRTMHELELLRDGMYYWFGHLFRQLHLDECNDLEHDFLHDETWVNWRCENGTMDRNIAMRLLDEAEAIETSKLSRSRRWREQAEALREEQSMNDAA